MNERRNVWSAIRVACSARPMARRFSSLSIPAIAQVCESAISAQPAWTTLKPRRLIRTRTAGSLSPIPSRRVPRLWKLTSAPYRLRTARSYSWMACDVVASSLASGVRHSGTAPSAREPCAEDAARFVSAGRPGRRESGPGRRWQKPPMGRRTNACRALIQSGVFSFHIAMWLTGSINPNSSLSSSEIAVSPLGGRKCS